MFYIYAHTRLDTGKIFYIGKGQGERYLSNKYRNRHWYFIVQKNNGKFNSSILRKCVNEKEAFDLEKKYIRLFRVLFGSNYLANVAEGGIGGKTTEIVWNKGKRTSEENRKKLRKPKSYQGRLNMRKARLQKFKDPVNHPRWIGFIQTPNGVFKTQKEAAKANFMSQSRMNKLIRDESSEKYRYLAREDKI